LPPISSAGASPLSAALGAAAAGVAGARGAAAAAAVAAAGGGAAATGFVAARGPLKLCVEGLNDAEPDDIAYTYSHSGCAPPRKKALKTKGRTTHHAPSRAHAPLAVPFFLARCSYAPLSVRLVAHASRATWRERGLEEVFKALPGPSFELTQGTDEHGAPAELPLDQPALDAATAASAAACAPGRLPPVLVVFVGGATYTEISALRFLSRPEAEGARLCACVRARHCARACSLTRACALPVRARAFIRRVWAPVCGVRQRAHVRGWRAQLAARARRG
jgi:hypothetical protein